MTGTCGGDPWRLNPLKGRPDLSLIRTPGWPGGRQLSPDRLSKLLGASGGVVVFLWCAPPEGPRTSAWDWERTVNEAAASQVCAAAASQDIRTVFASSAQVYGPWRDEKVSEHDSLAPDSPYAQAKANAEQAVADAGGTSLRLSTVFGPGELRHRAIPSFAHALEKGQPARIDGDGSDLLDYVGVEDVATAVLAVAGRLFEGEAVPPAINIGSGTGRTTFEVLHEVAAALGCEADYVQVPSARPQSRLVLNIDLSRDVLSFRPSAFRDALGRELAWRRAMGQQLRADHVATVRTDLARRPGTAGEGCTPISAMDTMPAQSHRTRFGKTWGNGVSMIMTPQFAARATSPTRQGRSSGGPLRRIGRRNRNHYRQEPEGSAEQAEFGKVRQHDVVDDLIHADERVSPRWRK